MAKTQATTTTINRTNSSKSKYTVSLADEAAASLEAIADKKGLSVTDLVRRAIALQIFVEDELDRGTVFLLRHPDGETERLRFVFA